MATTDGSVTVSTPRVTGGLPLRDLLAVPALEGYRVAAGSAGLDRIVRGANVMEVPDILDWVKPHELLVTTAYSLREDPDQLTELIGQLADRELAGLGIKLGRYVDELPAGARGKADAAGFPRRHAGAADHRPGRPPDEAHRH